MDELITIIEDEEYDKCFIITVNRYPDYPVRFDIVMNNNRSILLDNLEKTLYTTIKNKIFLYNDNYESFLAENFDIYLYNNLTISVYTNNEIKVCLVQTDNDYDITNSSELTKEEGIELINKLLDINEMIKRGEL